MHGECAAGAALGQRRDKCVFRWKPVVEGAFGHPGVRDQIVEADIVVAVAQKQLGGPFQQLRTADVGMLNYPRHTGDLDADSGFQPT